MNNEPFFANGKRLSIFVNQTIHVHCILLIVPCVYLDTEKAVMRRSRGGGTGGPEPPPPRLENHKNSNNGPGPHKNHKATKPAFNVGQSSARQRNAAGGPMLAKSGI